MTTVYAFPPVAIVAHSPWFERAPINVSRSMFTGARIVSAAQRKRRVAQLTVSVLSADRSGAGYMENLRLLLAGGENLVRLHSAPVNWWMDDQRLAADRQSQPLTWETGTDPDVAWTDGDPVHWMIGRVLLGLGGTYDAGGFDAVSITGGPPNTLIARPGDLVTLFSPIDATTGSSARVMRAASTDAAGAAVVRLMGPLIGAGRVNIGTSETAAFELTSMSEPMQPLAGNWTYDLAFSEVFAEEVPGGFTEVNPWL